MQYSLDYTKLVDLYQNFALNYHSRFVSLASQALRDTYADGLNATDFYTNRPMINTISFVAVRNMLLPYGVTVHDFQLRRVSLPAATESRIIGKLVSSQQAVTAANVQQQTQINAQAGVIIGQIQQEIELYQANQTQIATVVTNRASATAKQLQLSSQSAAYQAFSQLLGFDNSELLQYLYLRNARNAPDKTRISVGFTTTNVWTA